MKQLLSVPSCAPEWIYIPDVRYRDDPGAARSLQLLVPLPAHDRFPLIVFVPGSAWYKQEMYNAIPSYAKLAERGYVVAAVQYRESTIARFPAQVEDVERAIHFLISRADEFHIDARHIYLAGNSSGGHIALLTVLRCANGIRDAADFSVAIRGVIAESAPSDLLPDGWSPAEVSRVDGFHPVEDLLGVANRMDDVPSARAASCPMYVRRDIALPPILLIHGSRDPEVPAAQSRALYEQLTRTGHAADLCEIDGAGHGGAVFWCGQVLDVIEAFISAHRAS